MSKKVFILSDGGHDISDARRFGDIVKLAMPSYAKHDTSLIYSELKEKLNDATEEDYLMVSHMPSHLAIATGIMVEWYGRVNFLIFRKDKYEEKTVVFSED